MTKLTGAVTCSEMSGVDEKYLEGLPSMLCMVASGKGVTTAPLTRRPDIYTFKLPT